MSSFPYSIDVDAEDVTSLQAVTTFGHYQDRNFKILIHRKHGQPVITKTFDSLRNMNLGMEYLEALVLEHRKKNKGSTDIGTI